MFKTSKIGRFLNTNIGKIILVILIFGFIFIITQTINNVLKKQEKDEKPVLNYQTQQEEQVAYFTNTKIDEKTANSNNEVIDEFIEYCNASDSEMAYSLLTNDCKEQLYPTLDSFTRYYLSRVFSTPKSYEIEVISEDLNTYTYKVKMVEDIMSTGKYDSSKVVEDYITIVKDGNSKKININSYIGKQDINVTKEEKDIKITVISKQIYMDYEIYKIKVDNNSKNTIMLDSKESVQSTYLENESETRYSSYIDEMIAEELQVLSNDTKEINIKFNKVYNPNNVITKLVLSDIVENYEEYANRRNFNKIQMEFDI